jgi:CRISPR-associated protein Cas2
MLEVRAGVFVGKLSLRVRERLWAKVCASKKAGGSVLIARAASEQGFSIVTHGDPSRSIIDMEGLQLVARRVAAAKV